MAVDISPRSLKLAQQRVPEGHFVCARNLALPFADGSFDAVVADGVIHHTPEDRDVSWNIAVKRGIIKALPKGLRDWAEAIERAMSQVRARVEHPFHVVKNLFRHKKLRYRGLAKNTAQLHTLFALANLVIVKKTLLARSPV